MVLVEDVIATEGEEAGGPPQQHLGIIKKHQQKPGLKL